MNKLSTTVYDKLIMTKATSKEIDFVLYLARYQNAYGEVEGVYHRDVEEELGISVQTFYDLKESLTEKGIIRCEKRDYSDWDITLLDNEFLGQDAYKKGYFQLHLQMFHSEAFQKMRAGAKLLAMQFLRLNMINKCSHRIGVQKFFEEYGKKLQVKEGALRSYLTEIREFFYINISNKNYYFKIKNKVMEIAQNNKTANSNYNEQLYRTALRRNKIKKVYSNEETDIKKYLNAHHEVFRKLRAGAGFVEAVKQSIEEINREKSGKKTRIFRSSLVKKILKDLLEAPDLVVASEIEQIMKKITI